MTSGLSDCVDGLDSMTWKEPPHLVFSPSTASCHVQFSDDNALMDKQRISASVRENQNLVLSSLFHVLAGTPFVFPFFLTHSWACTARW